MRLVLLTIISFLYQTGFGFAKVPQNQRQKWSDFMEEYFTLTHVYSERNISPTITDIIPLCRIKKPSVDASGTDAVPVKVDLAVLGVISWNGRKAIVDD